MMKNEKLIEAFGGRPENGNVHLARSSMLNELSLLLQCRGLSTKEEYREAIVDDNCLGKPTVKSRVLSFRHLADLYSLDDTNSLFCLLVKLWSDSPEELPLLAFLCAYTRDYLLRDAVGFVRKFDEGHPVSREMIAAFIETKYPNRYSKATLKSSSLNLMTSLSRAGLIGGKVGNRIRVKALPKVNAVTMACILAYLSGDRGQYLLDNEFLDVIDCSKEKAKVLLYDAEVKGFVRIQELGEVFEVQFPILNEVDK